MDADKKTIGLTSSNKEIVELLLNQGLFKEQIDVARFAMALAINDETEAEEMEGAETVWNVGSFDPDGELRNLIPILYPNTKNPYKLIEFLVNIGVKKIGQKVKDPTFEISDFFK
jgi:Arc/MetJ-type ribon-helix-helix transcriptional regulator